MDNLREHKRIIIDFVSPESLKIISDEGLEQDNTQDTTCKIVHPKLPPTLNGESDAIL